MRRFSIFTLIILCLTSCSRFDNQFGGNIEIPDFDLPKTVDFEQNLSAYEIFQGNFSDLVPSEDFHLLELSSVLFSDYTHKQRLVKIPAGTQMSKLDDGSLFFPNGTILVKTFFYYFDERDLELGKRVIESRLLIKEDDHWNVATYIWNESQTDASLELNGADTQISWIDAYGSDVSTLYHIPNENECITCHQSNINISPIGPSLMNLNREVVRNGSDINQLAHLQSLGILDQFDVAEVDQIVNYKNLNIALKERARAYFAMNCAHCHNPDGWDESSSRDFGDEREVGQKGEIVQVGVFFPIFSPRCVACPKSPASE